MKPFRSDREMRGWFSLNADGPVTILIDTRSTARCGWNDRIIPWRVWRTPHEIIMQSYNPEPVFGFGVVSVADAQWLEVQARAYEVTA